MTLFSIHCTTCHARIAVRSESAIGQILACPKCGGMVQIAPPPGWQPGMVMESHATPPPGTIAPAPAPVPAPLDEPVAMSWLPWALVSVAILVVGGLLWAALSSGDAASPSSVAQADSIATAAPPSASEPPLEPVATTPEAQATAPVEVPPPAPPPPPEPTPAAEQVPASQPPPTPAPATTPAAKPASPNPGLAESERPVEAMPEPAPQVATVAPPAIEVRPPDSVPQVDAVTRLAQPIAALEFHDVALLEVVRFVSSASGVPISFDLESLQAAGKSPTVHVSHTSEATSLERLLDDVLATVGLRADVEPGQVIVRATQDGPAGASAVSPESTQALLARRVSAAFSEPTPLETVLRRLEDSGGVVLIVNYAALASVGRSGASTVVLIVHDAPLGEALDQLLPPLGLRYRAVDAGTLEITAR